MIKDFTYYVPVKLVFGEGALYQAGDQVSAYGKKAMIVTTGTFFKESGLVDRLQNILNKSGVDSVYFPEVDPNPLNTQIDNGAAMAKVQGDAMTDIKGGIVKIN